MRPVHQTLRVAHYRSSRSRVRAEGSDLIIPPFLGGPVPLLRTLCVSLLASLVPVSGSPVSASPAGSSPPPSGGSPVAPVPDKSARPLHSTAATTRGVQKADIDLGTLTRNQPVGGFVTEAVYLNDSGTPIGGRFVHRKSGFVLDFLRIESVPRAFTWVNTPPVSDQGEPHTQEHLLLGKGTTGRAFAGLETMWLSSSSAFTDQVQTCYHFNTAAGPAVFFDLFQAQMNALLHPNYTDEEIRREVCNFGVAENPDSTLRVEEKGTVYNEMVSTNANPYWKIDRSAARMVYGPDHPLARDAGGDPAGIRAMKPSDIRKFHFSNYYLGNMGTIASFPSGMPVREILERFDTILRDVEPEPSSRSAKSEEAFPDVRPATPETIDLVEYPYKNERQPSPILITWPANRALDPGETLLLEMFVSAFAGDPTTNLYKLFVDGQTRVMTTGAKGVYGSVGRHKGQMIQIGMTDVDVDSLTTEKLAAIRTVIVHEIDRIASLQDGSKPLAELNDRVSSRLAERERAFASFVNSPPDFGARSAGAAWFESLSLLARTGEFKRSLTYKPQVQFVRELLQTNKNFWRERFALWKISGVVPYVSAAKPSPSLLAREETARTARSQAEVERIEKLYTVADPQAAIKRYQAGYDSASETIEREASTVPRASFVKSPPRTLDDPLQFEVRTLEGGIPFVVSRFDNMTSATTGLALRLDGVHREQLRYVSLLPQLLTQVGVIENGKPVPFEEMSERLRKEILSLNASFSVNARTGRVELLVSGAGLGAAETARALEWMTLVLQHPDWRPENLPRIRDMVDQSLSALRNTMQGPEEAWVLDPPAAYRMQSNPAFLAADSALTASHNALRLRWLLKETPTGDAQQVAPFLTKLADAGKTAGRSDLKAFLAGAASTPASLRSLADSLAALPPPARAVADEALRDLDVTLIEIPDQSLAADWSYVCLAMRDDLLVPPAEVLSAIDAVRRSILKSGGARFYFVGSKTMAESLAPKIASLAASFERAPLAKASSGGARSIDARLRARGSSATAPVYVGLLAPNMTGGVIVTSAPGIHFADYADKDKQLDFLASRLFAGYGAHGIFLKTIGAGLAYSNGLRASVSSGRIGYYAERTPEIPQTVKFVIDELKGAARDTSLSEYAVALAFAEQRAALSYEARADGIAADLADGQPPELVRRFRESILELRKEPRLGERLFERKDKVNGWILPGYNVKGKDVRDAVYFVIGPDRQLDAWDAYLRAAEGKETRLFKLYPRDFWMP